MWGRRVQVTIGMVVLSVIGVGLGLVPVVSSHWGKFSNYKALAQGYFGPWKLCIYENYRRSLCGHQHSRFRPRAYVFASGVAAALGLSFAGVTTLLLVTVVFMMHTRAPVACGYRTSVWCQVGSSVFACFFSALAGVLFSLQGDAPSLGFAVSRDWAFYIQIVVIVIYFAVAICCGFILRWFRELGGDPTLYSRDPEGCLAKTVRNPSFRDASGGFRRQANGHVVLCDLTDIGVKAPQPVILSNGAPLKSSLKKKTHPAGPNGFTLENPGFSAQSPNLSRSASAKKVRIQTQITEV